MLISLVIEILSLDDLRDLVVNLTVGNHRADQPNLGIPIARGYDF
jgi:hypothetical protein